MLQAAGRLLFKCLTQLRYPVSTQKHKLRKHWTYRSTRQERKRRHIGHTRIAGRIRYTDQHLCEYVQANEVRPCQEGPPAPDSLPAIGSVSDPRALILLAFRMRETPVFAVRPTVSPDTVRGNWAEV